jgi:hypothetical protein
LLRATCCCIAAEIWEGKRWERRRRTRRGDEGDEEEEENKNRRGINPMPHAARLGQLELEQLGGVHVVDEEIIYHIYNNILDNII